MNLKEKVIFLSNKYNKGIVTNYAENMIDAIERSEAGDKNYEVYDNFVIRKDLSMMWSVEQIIGEGILIHDPNIFK